jgi:hypothetical protein
MIQRDRWKMDRWMDRLIDIYLETEKEHLTSKKVWIILDVTRRKDTT